MPSYSRHDFDSMSYSIADSFQSGTSLNSAVLKMAADKSMNPEQVKRLTEAVNTTVFLKMFKDKPSEDKMVEFEVADPTVILDKLLGSGSEHKSTLGGGLSIILKGDAGEDSVGDDSDDSMFFDDIADEVKSAGYTRDKVASFEETTHPQPVHTVTFEKRSSDLNLLNNKHRRLQAEEALLTKQAAHNFAASDLATDIASSFRGIYNAEKYAGFELDCIAQFGNSCIPALQMVRNRLGRPKFAAALTPAQENYLRDRRVVEASPLIEKVASLVEHTVECLKVAKSLKHLA